MGNHIHLLAMPETKTALSNIACEALLTIVPN